MKTLITGGAGFVGSHLCERFLAEGHEVICVDNFITGSPGNIEHLQHNQRFSFIRHDISHPLEIDGPIDNILHFASPASPVDYLRHPIPTLKVGSLGTHNTLGLAKAKNARYLLASTSEVYGDPRSPSAARGLLGQRQPHRRPRRLRRSQALRRGDDDGLPPLPRRRHAHRPHLQHLRRTHAPRRRPRRAQPHGPGPARRAADRLRRRLADAQLLLRRRPGRGHLSACFSADFHEPVNLGNPNEVTILEFAKEILDLSGSKSQIEFKPLPQDDPKVRRPDITRARTLLGWEPKVQRHEGMRRTLEYFQGKVSKGNT